LYNAHQVTSKRQSCSDVAIIGRKNHDFTPKNLIFPILGGARAIFGVFHVKNHDFTPKKSYFYQF
jgi:hypothetical protein